VTSRSPAAVVAEELRAACAVLSVDSGPAAATARTWGDVDEAASAGRLLLVEPRPGIWRRVHVIVDGSGAADEVIFELPEGQSVPVSGLVESFGEGSEEQIVDGGRLVWFCSPTTSACRVSAALRRTDDDGWTSGPFSVVRPDRRP